MPHWIHYTFYNHPSYNPWTPTESGFSVSIFSFFSKTLHMYHILVARLPSLIYAVASLTVRQTSGESRHWSRFWSLFDTYSWTWEEWCFPQTRSCMTCEMDRELCSARLSSSCALQSIHLRTCHTPIIFTVSFSWLCAMRNDLSSSGTLRPWMVCHKSQISTNVQLALYAPKSPIMCGLCPILDDFWHDVFCHWSMSFAGSS